MGGKKTVRTLEVTIEKRERILLPAPLAIDQWCPVCLDVSRFLPVADAAQRFCIRQSEIFRHADDGSIGSSEPADGVFWVCAACLGSIR